MSAPVIQFKRGVFSSLPGLRAGEPGFTTDKYDLYVGIDSTTNGNKFFGSHRYWTKETSTTGSGVNLVEGTDNGENAITLKAPASLGSSYTITFPDAIVDNGYLKVASDGTLSWDAQVDSENIEVTGIATIAQLKATTATVGAGLTVSGDTDLNGNLDVDGFAELDAVNISETLSVAGVSTFTGNIDANGDLDVDGFTELDDANVSGTLNVVGVSTFTGNIDANGNLDVDGFAELDAVNISETLSVTGVSTFTGDIDANGNLDVAGGIAGNFNATGVSTAAFLQATTVNASGIVTASSFSGSGSGLSSGTVPISSLDIDGGTAASALTADDLFIIDDGAGGTNKKLTAQQLSDYVLGGSGGATFPAINVTGIGTIAQLQATTATVGAGLTVSGDADLNGNLDVAGGITGNLNATGVSTAAFLQATTVNASGIVTASSFVGDDIRKSDGSLIPLVGVATVSAFTGLVTAFKFVGTGLEDFSVVNGVAEVSYSGVAASTYTTSSTFTATEGQTSFNFVAGYVDGFVDVYLNGIRLITDVDFTANDGANVVLSSGATAGDELEIVSFKELGNLIYVQNLKVVDNLTAGIVTATGSFNGNLNATGVSTAGFLQAITVNASGIVTASSFSGSGSGLSAGTVPASAIDIDGATAATALTSDDLFIIDDGANGTNKKLTAQQLSNYVLGGSGGATFPAINVTGIGTIAQLQATTATVGAGLTVTGDADLNGNLDVDGFAELDDANVSGTLNVVGVSTFTGAIDANGNLDVDGFTELDAVNISETLSVTGVSTFTGNIDANGNLDVDGFAELDAVNISETLSVTGVSTFTGAIDANGNLDVDGFTELDAVNISETLSVTGVSTFTGAIDANGGANISGSATIDQLTVSGVTTSTGGFVGDLTGNADTATALDNARDFQITGDASSAVVSFDGTANVGLAVTLATVNNDTGSFGSQTEIPVITVNEKGLVTAVTTASVGTALTVTGDSGSETIDLLTEALAITGGTNLNSSAASNGITVNLDNDISLTSVVASGIITATSGFSGNLTGNVTGNVSGNLNSVGVSTILFLKATTATVGAGLTVTGATDLNGGLDVSGGETVLSSATVSDLTSGRVVLAGTSGALEDSGNLTFGANGLTVTGGALVSAASTFSSDLAVGGNVIVSGDLTVNGTTSQINTVEMTVEDTLIELQVIDGSAPSNDTNKDVGVVMNYFDSSAKKAAFYWDDSAGRMVAASEVSETSGVLTASTFAGLEIGSLYVNDCAGASQVISCSGTTRSLENITIDGGSF